LLGIKVIDKVGVDPTTGRSQRCCVAHAYFNMLKI
jgi:hypothetical protein